MFEIINIEKLLKLLKNYDYKELHVHHTWQPNHSNFNGDNAIELQNNMRDYHLSLGWEDIGQHVTLLPNGLFVTGRDFGRTPASISGCNEGAFALEMLGNFDIGEDVFEGEQKLSALKLAKYFYDKGKNIRFHRENSPKTCPGTSIDKDVFMDEVKSLGNIQSIESKEDNSLPSIKYQVHVQNMGWQEEKKDGEVAGTVGQSLRIEALAVNYLGSENIQIEGHIQNIGWQPIRANGEVIGTVGKDLRLEAIRIKIEGRRVAYQVHRQDYGWTDWYYDWQIAGTIGESKRIEAIRILIDA